MKEQVVIQFDTDINTMLCPIIFNSNTIELTVHTSCYCLELTLCYCANPTEQTPPDLVIIYVDAF